MNDSSDARASGSPRNARVNRACDRCRRYKSRCDDFRPCSICTRAKVSCVSGSAQRQRKGRRPRTRQQKDAPQPRDVSDGTRLFIAPDNVGETQSMTAIMRKIFELSSWSFQKHSTSALPDGVADPKTGLPGSPRLPIESVLGFAMPSHQTMCVLLEEYFECVHWFSVVIYEPNFRAKFDSIADGLAYPEQRPFLFLLATVLAMASWYRSKRQASAQEEDWPYWAETLVRNVESHTMDVLDGPEIECIQTCVLLGSHNSYHGKPRAALALLGASVKTAQASGMHRESAAQSFDEREERKRVWWTIYTWDRWASTTFGRPFAINEDDCNVSMPADIYENRFFVRQQQADSICYSTYQTQLNKLYTIASPGLREQLRAHSGAERVTHATLEKRELLLKGIIQELWRWKESLPGHLALDLSEDIPAEPSAALKVARMQALSLQLTFDHLIIILHRPFLATQVMQLPSTDDAHTPSLDPPPPDSARDEQNAEQWWHAALRTAQVTQLPHTAQFATDGHLVAFLGVNLLNAAIVLVIYSLAKPLTDRAQEAKRNLTSVLRLQEVLARRSQIARQSVHVLRSLILLITKRESQAMLATPIPSNEDDNDHHNNGFAVDSAFSTVFSGTGMHHGQGAVGDAGVDHTYAEHSVGEFSDSGSHAEAFPVIPSLYNPFWIWNFDNPYEYGSE